MLLSNSCQPKSWLNLMRLYQQVLQRHCLLPLAVVFLLCLCGFARAEFDTIIDSPPAEFERYGRIESNTQVNLYPGGVLPSRYRIGPTWEPGDNIEINLLGGSIGEEGGYSGLSTSSNRTPTTNVTVNLIEGNVWGYVEGTADSLITLNGATVSRHMSMDKGTLNLIDGLVGGSVKGTAGALIALSGATVHGDLSVKDGSLAIISGGRITDELSAHSGSSVQLSSGSIGSGQSVFSDGAGAYDGSVFLMSGGDINGAFTVSDSYASITGGRVTGRIAVTGSGQIEIAGGVLGPLQVHAGGIATLVGGEFQMDGVPIDGLGTSTQAVDFPDNSVLTGVLRDGTPVILSNLDILHDYIADEHIQLRLAPVPASQPRHFDTAVDTVPSGLRNGQSLTLRPGTQTPVNFTALPGSTVSIIGGDIGRGFEAAGASITMSAGRIRGLSTIYQGTTLRMSGGDIDSNFEVAAGSRLEVSGGTIGSIFVVHSESEVLFSGGKFTGSLEAQSGSSFTIAGGDFRLNGELITSPAASGTEQPFDLPESGVLSGVLGDGTPFIFGSRDGRFAPGTLTLKSTDIPAVGQSVFRVPSDPAPNGLRSGQTLLLSDGGDLGDHFTADWGSIVRMSGGRIGHRFRTVGSFVNVTGGEIDSLDALLGSVVNIDGGAINHHVNVRRGAILNIFSGGSTGTVYVDNGGRVNMTGGTLGRYVYVSGSLDIQGGVAEGDISLYGGGTLTLQGGETHGEIRASNGSRLNIKGGRLADGLSVAEGGIATLSGTDFRIDGESLGDDSLNTIRPVDLPSGAVLSGVLADGTPFAFTSSEGDRFSPGTLKLSSNRYLSIPGTISLPIHGFTPPKGLRPDEKLTLESGENVGANFTAGWDSQLTVNGGEIGSNFEAVGAQISLLDGVIGEDMDVLFGSELTIEGGTIGEGLQAHQGSIVNISGGIVPSIEVRADSQVHITGGIFGEYLDGEYNRGRITLETGSELEITGTDFLINGMPVEGLEEGDSLALNWKEAYLNSSLGDHLLSSIPFSSISLSARLPDGSPFAANISSGFLLHFSGWQSDWQSNGPSTIILTMKSADAVVPEPSSAVLVIAAFVACARRQPNTVCLSRSRTGTS